MSTSRSADSTLSTIQQYRALLDVSEAIARHRHLAGLFQDMAVRLREVASFDFISLVLHDRASGKMRLHLLEAARPNLAHVGAEFDVAEAPGGWVWETQQPLVVRRIEHEPRFPRTFALMRENGVVSCCWVPVTTAQRRLGAMAFGTFEEHDYQPAEVDFLAQVARQVAVAVDNVLNQHAAESYQRQVARERDRLRVLLDLTNALVSRRDLRQVFAESSARIRDVVPNDYTNLVLYDAESGRLRVWSIDVAEGAEELGAGIDREMIVPAAGTPSLAAIEARRPLVFTGESLARFDQQVTKQLITRGVQSVCCVPLLTPNGVIGTLNAVSRDADAFSPDHVEFLAQIGAQVAIAVENALAYREIDELRNRLSEEKLYLEDEILSEHNFEEIIGESAALRRVLAQAETVAPTGSTVLLLGETGTGKEMVARVIHKLSGRAERTFVKVNCAAIPGGLLESELFGHEKGAFTGAIAQRIGRLELADGGTLFLDEIGDMPAELQPKLLRMLQEHEFERLGGSRTLRVDVRLIAATNRDLGQMVAAREFRSDLYYRLNVFPITVPPLRDRPEDIPPLTRYFAQKYARQMDRRIESIPAGAWNAMMRYAWPGNVRELQNFVERAVILSRGPALALPLAELQRGTDVPPAAPCEAPVTMQEAEREHILATLRETGWVIGGAKGAAARLGMKRTTLQSRMKKLGITRPA